VTAVIGARDPGPFPGEGHDPRERASGVPRLHVVTDDAVLANPDFVRRSVDVLEVGGPRVALHVRGPRSTGRVVYDAAVALASAARSRGAVLLVNDRVDVALASGADGAHLGGRSLPLSEARALLGAERLIGCSAHDTETVARDREGGADFAFVGHVYETATHAGEPAIGVAALAAMTDAAGRLPILAIGGVEPGRVAEVVTAGAWGVAVVGGVWRRPDPAKAVLDYLSALESAPWPSTEGR
jgi:thiamine-phosphate pyrophosphorylase